MGNNIEALNAEIQEAKKIDKDTAQLLKDIFSDEKLDGDDKLKYEELLNSMNEEKENILNNTLIELNELIEESFSNGFELKDQASKEVAIKSLNRLGFNNISEETLLGISLLQVKNGEIICYMNNYKASGEGNNLRFLKYNISESTEYTYSHRIDKSGSRILFDWSSVNGDYKNKSKDASYNGVGASYAEISSSLEDVLQVEDEVSADQVSADQVSADQVSADQVSADEVSADQVSADPVSADQVSADPVSADKVSTDPVSTDPVSTDTTPESFSDNAKAIWYLEGRPKNKQVVLEYFGVDKVDAELISKIKDFQKANNLGADGLAGSGTIGKINELKSSNIDNKNTDVKDQEIQNESENEEPTILDNVSESLKSGTEWLKETLTLNKELQTFVGKNGREVDIEFNEASNTFDIDTRFLDGVSDSEMNNLILDLKGIDKIKSLQDAESFAESNKKSIKEMYDSIVLKNTLDMVNNYNFTTNRSFNVSNFENQNGELMQVKLARLVNSDGKFKEFRTHVDTGFNDGISDSDTSVLLSSKDGKIKQEDIDIAVQESKIKYETELERVKSEKQEESDGELQKTKISNEEMDAYQTEDKNEFSGLNILDITKLNETLQELKSSGIEFKKVKGELGKYELDIAGLFDNTDLTILSNGEMLLYNGESIFSSSKYKGVEFGVKNIEELKSTLRDLKDYNDTRRDLKKLEKENDFWNKKEIEELEARKDSISSRLDPLVKEPNKIGEETEKLAA